MRRVMKAVLGAGALSMAIAPLPAAAQTATPAPTGTTRYIVRFTKDANPRSEANEAKKSGAAVRKELGAVFPGMVADLPPAAVNALKRNKKVAAIEPDGVVRAIDTQSGATWGLDRIDQRALPLSGTFTYPTAGAGVTAYIIDTGVLAGHADFGGRVAAGYDAVNDGNGTNDCNGHGTHVAGTVAGSTYGVAKQATIVPVRVLGCTGSGSWSSVIAGLDWVVAHHAAGTPAVANLSLGGGASSTVDAAVQAAIADGVTVAVAAGNSNADACLSSPARAANALTVGATDRTDTRASFSNYGTCVDLFAPGVSIVSDWYTSTTATASLSGTSMASPHVAGAAALVLAQSPGLTPADVGAVIKAGATAGVVVNRGTGSPNALLYADPVAMTPPTTTTTAPTTTTTAPTTTTSTAPTTTTTAPTTTTTTARKVPGKPGKVKATPVGKISFVTWERAADNGSPLQFQTLTIYRDGKKVASYWMPPWAASVFVLPMRESGSYTFTVSATNAVGPGAESDQSNVLKLTR